MRTWVPKSLVTRSCRQAAESGCKPGLFYLPEQPPSCCLSIHPCLLCSPSETVWDPSLSAFLSHTRASSQGFPGAWEFLLCLSTYAPWDWSSLRPANQKSCRQETSLGGSVVWTTRLSSTGSQEWWLSTLVAHSDHQRRFQKHQWTPGAHFQRYWPNWCGWPQATRFFKLFSCPKLQPGLLIQAQRQQHPFL